MLCPVPAGSTVRFLNLQNFEIWECVAGKGEGEEENHKSL